MSTHNLGGNYWGYLINRDKSPAPLLDSLCLGITKVISTELEPKNTKALTPQKLAAFYRAVGGNYDSLFLKTPHASLSLIYQQLGCFHTLQPTENAFEPPSIPALLPCGFVRWQTIQILLNPDENYNYLQAALQKFDIPSNGGITFPRVLPREAFPSGPDKEMVRWHDTVGDRLQRDSLRLKNSPQHSPFDPGPHHVSSNDERMDFDYFPRSAATRPSSSRPATRPHRSGSYDPRNPQGDRRRSNPDNDPGSSSFTMRPPDPAFNPWTQYHPPPFRGQSNGRHRHSSSRSHSPPQSSSSGSDASSEADSPQLQRRTTTWSHAHLFPPHIHVHHARRHSHDATYSYSSDYNPHLSPRPRDRHKDPSPPSSYAPPFRYGTGGIPGRSRERDLSDPSSGSAKSGSDRHRKSATPGGPVSPNTPPMPRRWVKPDDPFSSNPGSGGSDRERDRDINNSRKFGAPMRVNTVTGVGGRRYPARSQPASATSVAPDGWR